MGEIKMWTNEPLAVLDVETTGFKPEHDRMVEVAVARFEAGELVRSWSALINPGMPMPADAAAVNGITDEMLAEAPRFSEVAVDIREACAGAQLVAYNESFDRGFLSAELQRNRQALWYEPDTPWLDPMVWIREIDRYVRGKGRHKLGVSCERHGVVVEGDLHRALADAVATGRLLQKISERIGRRLAMATVLRSQIKLARKQDEDYRRWRQGLRGAR
jgi:DNA polymerase-3 subunit epsilon